MGTAEAAILKEPYLSAEYHMRNFEQFLAEVAQHSRIRRMRLMTHTRSEAQLPALTQVIEASGIHVDMEFSADLHEREFSVDSGIIVACNRGLDCYTKMWRGTRRTRRCKVRYVDVDRVTH